MFERFTEPAKRAIVASQTEAVNLNHSYIGTGHLLVGLLDIECLPTEVLAERGVTAEQARTEAVRLMTEAGVAANAAEDAAAALATLGIDVEQIRRNADASFGPGKFLYPRPAYSPRSKRALEHTLREAVALGHEHIEPEHMLLGLLADDEGTAAGVLAALDVDRDALRTDVRERMAPATPGGGNWAGLGVRESEQEQGH